MGSHRKISEVKTIRAQFEEQAREINLTRYVIEWYLANAATSQIETVNLLFAKEFEVRKENRSARLLKRAKFPNMRSIEGFDFDGVVFDSCDKQRMLALDFVEDAENLVFFGPSGRGKSHLATALGIRATQQGLETRWWSAAALVSALSKAQKEQNAEKIIKDLAKSDLIIVDEFGYVPFSQEGSKLLFQVLASCYEHTSIIFTTNLQFSQWGSVFGDQKLARAAIDRIIHHGHMMKFEGPDRRMRDSPMYNGKDKSHRELESLGSDEAISSSCSAFSSLSMAFASDGGDALK